MTTKVALETTRFGVIEFEDRDIVTMREGLVGLTHLRQFVLIQHKEGSPFRWMQSLDDGSMAFLVVDPNEFVEGYSPEMPESASCALNLTEETPILVYTICNIPNGNPKGMTLNLAGPIVINATSQYARQVVLEREEYPVRFKVFSEKAADAA